MIHRPGAQPALCVLRSRDAGQRLVWAGYLDAEHYTVCSPVSTGDLQFFFAGEIILAVAIHSLLVCAGLA